MDPGSTGLYRFLRWLIGLALGFYFRGIECFHAERVPRRGPVLFVSNHPNSVTDSFVIGQAVKRKVNFVATVQLFRFTLVRWLLTQCGVIPINRLKDDPKAMRTVAETFEACYRVLEAGEAIGIFPEGVSYDDSQLKEIKSGPARLALEVEHRHGGQLGLQIAPVGLTYSAKEIYRSEVLAHFGEPIRAADFLAGYAERRKECIRSLTAEIERRLQALIVHLPALEHARVVAGVQRLYLARLVEGRGLVEGAPASGPELIAAQGIVEAVEEVYRTQPARAGAFAARLDHYEQLLHRLRIPDEHLARFPTRGKLAASSFGGALLALIGAPVALYGWVHRALPVTVVEWAVAKFTEPGKRKAQTSSVAILSGIIVFVVCFGVYACIFHLLFGWPASLWYALSLPPASLVAHYYLRELRGLAGSLRNAVVLLRAPLAARRLATLRAELIAEIETARAELPAARQPGT